MSSTAIIPPAPVRVAPPVDFPDWLPPMLVKELRQGLRAKGFVGLFIAFHVLAVLVFWWSIEINAASGLRETFTWLNGVFWALLNLVLLIVMPWRGLGGLRPEIDNRTIDLLMLTRLTAWRVVLGKWVAFSAQTLLFLVALLPYGVVRYFFGSVNLVQDLAQVGWMLLVSLMLVAAALWVSGLPKFFRILLPVVLVVGAQSFGMAAIFSRAMSSSGGALGGAGSSGLPFLAFGWTQFLLLVLFLVVFLGLAVRRLAPPAENHSMAARLLGFLLVAAAFVGAVILGGFGASAALGFGFCSVATVGAVEMARDCLPMNVHWRPWRGRGRLWAGLGRLLLPGWSSAAVFAAAALALLALPTLFIPSWRPAAATGFSFAWWLMLGWQALVFPALLLSFLPVTSSMRIGGTGYFVLQGLMGTISLLAASNSAGFIAGENFAHSLDALCHVVPVFSFWLGVDGMKGGFSAVNVAGQLIALLVLVVLVRRQSRIYWGTIARFDAAAVERPAGAP